MPAYSNNTLMIARPTQGCSAVCGTQGLGCDIPGMSARKTRGKVIEELQDFILLSLGFPIVGVELDQQNLDSIINYVLQYYEMYAPREYYNYYTFATTPGQSVYTMPPDVGYVRQVAYRATPEFAFQATDLNGAIPIEYFYPGGAYSSIQGGMIDPLQPIFGRSGEWFAYKSYERMYTRMSSGLGGWEWIDGYRTIKIYPIPFRTYHVIVHYMQKCKDWTEATVPMKEGCLAWAKQVLGRALRKYRNLPGPQGGIQLDGAELYMEGKEEWDKWKDDLLYRWGDLLTITLA